MNTGRGAKVPLEINGPDSFFPSVGLATPPLQHACYLPSIAGTHLIYTPGSKGSHCGKVPYSRAQHNYRNGARTHNLLFMNPALTRAHRRMMTSSLSVSVHLIDGITQAVTFLKKAAHGRSLRDYQRSKNSSKRFRNK